MPSRRDAGRKAVGEEDKEDRGITMRTSGLIILTLFALVLSSAAFAQWQEMTASWSSQGLLGSSRLITDPNTQTLYYIHGTQIKSYDANTDSWTDLSPTVGDSVGGFGWPEGAFFTPGGDAGRIVVSYSSPRVDVYDIATNTWYKNDAPTSEFEFSWGQGNFYNPVSGEFWNFWTDNVSDGETNEIHSLVGAAYDPVTDTWGEAQVLDWPADYFWGRMESVNVGDTNYSIDDNDYYVGTYPKLRMLDLTATPQFPVSGTVTSEFDLGEGEYLAYGCYGTGSAFRTQMLAAYGDDIYIAGLQQSDVLLVYHTDTDTWDMLDPRPNNDIGLGCRDHTVAIADGILYVQDGSQFWSYRIEPIPEPCTTALIAFGGLAALANLRRRRSR